jgi:uncharacterized protein YkwD
LAWRLACRLACRLCRGDPVEYRHLRAEFATTLAGGADARHAGTTVGGVLLRRTPAHAMPMGRRLISSGHVQLLSVVGLLLSALGITAFLLPASSGEGQRHTAADPPPAGVGFLGPAPSASSPPTTSPAPAAAPSRAKPSTTTVAGSPRRTPGAAVTAAPARTAASGDTAQEDQVTALVNQERTRAGCGAVRTDERLRAAARGHSRDMAARDYFSHTAPGGSTFVDRAVAAGYPREAAGGENIAMGYRTPAEVMAGWMDSEGHRANILNCDFEAVGVGLARDSGGTPYWTQVFGRT